MKASLPPNLVLTETVPRTIGGPFEWTFFDPRVLVEYVLAESPVLTHVYRDVLRHAQPQTSARAWHMILAFDENTPGNKLAHRNVRKNMVVGFNFKEVGRIVLSRACTWFVPVVVRSSQYKHACGGWSGLF